MATHPTPEDNDRSGDQQDLSDRSRRDLSRRDRFVYTEDDSVFITHDPLRQGGDDRTD